MANEKLKSRRDRGRRAFTLVEVLVVIGIIVLISGLLLPALLKAYRTGVRTRAEADLHLIETALDAYKQDFGDYPRFATPADDQAAVTLNVQPWLDMRQDRGAILLCRALIGPGPGGTLPSVDTGSDLTQVGSDGADGPGFRTRRNMSTTLVTGKVWGPYVQPDKFKLGGTDTTYFKDATILDSFGKPILYYPAAPGITQLTAANSYVAAVDPTTVSLINPVTPLYNSYDNASLFATLSMQNVMRADTGATTPGALLATKAAVYTGPYILWSSGADGIYGINASGKFDDITNFEIPVELQK